MAPNVQVQVQVRFLETIDGFNEEFCRTLFYALTEAWEDGDLYVRPVDELDVFNQIKPGWHSAANHLDNQIRWTGGSWDVPSHVKSLLEETEKFLKLLEKK